MHGPICGWASMTIWVDPDPLKFIDGPFHLWIALDPLKFIDVPFHLWIAPDPLKEAIYLRNFMCFPSGGATYALCFLLYIMQKD